MEPNEKEIYKYLVHLFKLVDTELNRLANKLMEARLADTTNNRLVV